jgi:large subunit ribosomal protein L18
MMAKGPSYSVPFRRRRKGKTDYKSRRALVLSGLPRLVIRGTSKYMITQVIEAETIGDRVVVSANSRELPGKYGWQGSCGNIPAAYLTGLLCGYRAVASGIKEAVLDMGLQAPSRGARVFAALRGVIDTGVLVPHDKGVLPDDSRISGQHIVDYANQLSPTPEIYQKVFSKYLPKKLKPEQISEHFSSIKEKIVSSFKGR